MPVLYQPSAETSMANLTPSVAASYTLNVITTQWISKGVLFRFQVWDGMKMTYDQAVASNGGLIQFDLVVQTPIPPATLCVVAFTQTGTMIYDYTGVQQYSTCVCWLTSSSARRTYGTSAASQRASTLSVSQSESCAGSTWPS